MLNSSIATAREIRELLRYSDLAMTVFRIAALLSLLAFQSVAQDISLLDGSLYCDAECKRIALDAASWERSQHVSEPLDSFYDTPPEFGTSTQPGAVLRVEKHTNLTDYTVPSGLTMSRILYASQDLNGTTVLASAFALWPYEVFDYSGKRKDDDKSQPTFPVVAWAHGTSGLYPRCAPSNYKALQYHFITTFNLAFEGFAVIAPDYAGLGASARPNGDKHPHQYLAAPAQANDLAFAVEAVRKAFPERLVKDGPFVAMGHSQGGNTAWAFAERQAKTPVPGYRGTITFSPSVDSIKSLKQMVQAAAAGMPVPAAAFSFVPLVSAAITAVYPSFGYSGLSDRVLDRWNKVIGALEVCLPSTNLLLAGFPVEDYIEHPEWVNMTEVAAWEERTAISKKKFAGPLSVILGGADIATPQSITATVDETCALPENKGEHLEYLQLGAMVRQLFDQHEYSSCTAAD